MEESKSGREVEKGRTLFSPQPPMSTPSFLILATNLFLSSGVSRSQAMNVPLSLPLRPEMIDEEAKSSERRLKRIEPMRAVWERREWVSM
jgi:hypothetical protein